VERIGGRKDLRERNFLHMLYGSSTTKNKATSEKQGKKLRISKNGYGKRVCD